MPHMQRPATAFLALIVFAIFVLFAALIILMTRPARADEGLPAGITCELIREKVAEHGKFVALAWAIRQGYSPAQIHAARRCLK
jgi:hypothetical protein